MLCSPTFGRRDAITAWRNATGSRLLYHVYLAALVSIVIVLFVSSAVGDRAVDASGLADLRANGPAIVGFIAALALAIGLRSGSRGGPMALEAAEVRHVLLAPIDRRRALLGSAERLMRYGAFIGALVGAVAGELASKRLPHGAPRWIAAGAATGMVIAVAAFGVAFLAGRSPVAPTRRDHAWRTAGGLGPRRRRQGRVVTVSNRRPSLAVAPRRRPRRPHGRRRRDRAGRAGSRVPRWVPARRRRAPYRSRRPDPVRRHDARPTHRHRPAPAAFARTTPSPAVVRR